MTKDCKLCGGKMIWENPHLPWHFHESSRNGTASRRSANTITTKEPRAKSSGGRQGMTAKLMCGRLCNDHNEQTCNIGA